MEYEPEPLKGNIFSEEVIRHSSSHVSIHTLGSETEIVHFSRRSQNECTIIISLIGARSQKALWDSGADASYPRTATTPCTPNINRTVPKQCKN